MSELTNWLLEGQPWVEYRTRLDLMDQSETNPQVLQARKAMLAHSWVKSLVAELSEWPGPILKSHKSAGHLLHKLTFVADLGLRANDPGMSQIVQRIFEHRSPENVFQILVNINSHYGGTGKDQFAWMLCDAPLVTYALVKFGLAKSREVQEVVSYLTSLIRENGWPCAVTSELGNFRGPGRKADPCPYANLVMLKLLAQFPESHADVSVKTGVEVLLSLWEQRKERRPYLFAMGSGFKKLKAPLVWYDILHVADVLTQIPWVRSDERLLEMVEIIKSKADENGFFTPESVWRDWKDWSFGKKRNPSQWLTLVSQRILKRAESIS
jgi:hypothetical protein